MLPAIKSNPLAAANRERGNVIIEMAIVLPFLLLVVAGVVDLGRLFWEQQVLTNATREGARYAARAGTGGAAAQTVTQVRQTVQNYLTKFNIQDAQGQPIVLALNVNFSYRWDLSVTPPKFYIEVTDIPTNLVLLPGIITLWGGPLTNINTAHARTTMVAEWSVAPLP